MTGNQTVPKIIVDHKYVDILMKQVWNSIWIWHSHVLRSWRIFGASSAADWRPRGIGATKQSQQVRERTKTQKVITYQLKRGSVSGVERVHSKESFSMVAVFHGKWIFLCSNPKKLTQNVKIWRFTWNSALFWHYCVETSRLDSEFSFFSCFLLIIVVYKQFLVYHSFTVHLLWRKIDSRLRFWHYLVEKSVDFDPKLSKMVKNHCICHVLTVFLAITDRNYQYFRKILLFLIFLGHFYVQMSLITFNFKNKWLVIWCLPPAPISSKRNSEFETKFWTWRCYLALKQSSQACSPCPN